jgi:thiol-disulfide isomerase/thioredoxin
MVATKTWNNRLLTSVTTFLIAYLFIQATHATDLREFTEDRPTPPLELADRHGKTYSLADYRGKVVLVNFWASWCTPCIQEIPELIRLAEILEDRPFVILAVNVGESKRKLPGFITAMEKRMVCPMDTESTAFKQWEGIGLPSTFVLDGSGRIRYEAYGPVNWDADYIVEALTELMEEDPAVTGSTNPNN